MIAVSVDEMREHVLSLCEREAVTVEWCRRSTEAWAARDLSLINIAPIRSAVTYATALHELGHVLGRNQQSRRVLIRERWAWVWAKSAALVWTERMDRCATASLLWYAQKEQG